MKFLLLALLSLSLPCWASDQHIYMLGKIKLQDTTHIKLVLFYDKEITNMRDCEREVQRGVRGQWRYHHHKFKTPRGYSQRVDYYCVNSDINVAPWYHKARYDFVYKVDIRSNKMRIKPEKSYVDCLHNLRREVPAETNKFFCAKLSQTIKQ